MFLILYTHSLFTFELAWWILCKHSERLARTWTKWRQGKHLRLQFESKLWKPREAPFTRVSTNLQPFCVNSIRRNLDVPAELNCIVTRHPRDFLRSCRINTYFAMELLNTLVFEQICDRLFKISGRIMILQIYWNSLYIILNINFFRNTRWWTNNEHFCSFRIKVSLLTWYIIF